MYADFDQWLTDQQQNVPAKKKKNKKEKPQKESSNKITYKERLELETIEESILVAEEEMEKCRQHIENPDVMSDAEELARWCKLLLPAQEKVDTLYARWEELEARSK